MSDQTNPQRNLLVFRDFDPEIHENPSIPLVASEAATQVFAGIGKRGSGKSYFAGVMAEEMLRHGIQIIVIDVVGTWWGLRAGKDGSPDGGYRIPVLGGQHGDIPLAHEGGALVASTLVDTNSSAVLDLSDMRKGQRQRFLTDWAEEFFHEKKSARSPVHVFFEEAHTLVPQRVIKGQERMLGAMEDLIRLGRNYGIGVTMLDQRPQSVNKEVLHQAEVLAVFQLPGPHERKAIKEWAEAKELPEVNTVLRDMAKLPRGQCILWSPEWLKMCTRVRVLEKRTLDASATPGEAPSAKAVKMRPVDLVELKRAMEEIQIGNNAAPSIRITKVTDDKITPTGGTGWSKGDPLHHQFVQDGKNREAEIEAKLAESLDIRAAMREDLDRFTKENVTLRRYIHEYQEIVVASLKVIEQASKNVVAFVSRMDQQPLTWKEKTTIRRPGLFVPPDPGHAVPGMTVLPAKIPKVERAMLAALATFQNGLTRRQVRIYAGYAEGGAVTSAFARIVEREWVVANNDHLVITHDGLRVLGAYTPAFSGSRLREHFAAKLDKVERKMFHVICERYPGAINRTMARELAGYKNGGAVTSGIAHLCSLDIVTVTAPGYVRAADELFEPGERRE